MKAIREEMTIIFNEKLSLYDYPCIFTFKLFNNLTPNETATVHFSLSTTPWNEPGPS
jgi:hypothetical protein